MVNFFFTFFVKNIANLFSKKTIFKYTNFFRSSVQKLAPKFKTIFFFFKKLLAFGYS